jgi:hypothetical protein
MFWGLCGGCGGYHSRDIRKRNIPNAMKAARRVSIFVNI